MAMDWIVVIAATVLLPVAYVAVVGGFVAGGALLCAWKTRVEPMDTDQARVFGAVRVRTSRRFSGFAQETVCQSVAFLMQGLYRIRLLRLPRGANGAPPVVVLPGYTENPGTVWWLLRHLARVGFDPIAIDFPSTHHPIEHNAAFLGGRLRAICAERGCADVPIVAHSMGGLVTRAWMLSRADHGVRTLVAVGSPFRGTFMARLGSLTGGGPSCTDMTPGSDHLRRHGPERALGVPVLSLVAPQENIVCPAWSVVLPEATHVVLEHPWGHEAPLFVDASLRVIETWLRDATDARVAR
jgi:pimeloyl-ACP methyl ester carboxylesterase